MGQRTADALLKTIHDFLRSLGEPGQRLARLCEEAVAQGLEETVWGEEGGRDALITVRPVETPQQRLAVYLRTLYVYLVELPLAVQSAVATLRGFNPNLAVRVAPPEGVSDTSEYGVDDIVAVADHNKQAFDDLIAALKDAGEGEVAEWMTGNYWRGSGERSVRP